MVKAPNDIGIKGFKKILISFKLNIHPSELLTDITKPSIIDLSKKYLSKKGKNGFPNFEYFRYKIGNKVNDELTKEEININL